MLNSINLKNKAIQNFNTIFSNASLWNKVGKKLIFKSFKMMVQCTCHKTIKPHLCMQTGIIQVFYGCNYFLTI